MGAEGSYFSIQLTSFTCEDNFSINCKWDRIGVGLVQGADRRKSFIILFSNRHVPELDVIK